jgi:flagellar biosynthesis/type III secretory pathway M-ring protein FliF/YscJ
MDQLDVGEIVDKLNVPLEQIKRMAIEKPNMVAMLLKSWLLEDKR